MQRLFYPVHPKVRRACLVFPGVQDKVVDKEEGMKIIGLCGFAGTGKDTAASTMKGWKRFAFADALKADLIPLASQVGCDLFDPEDKRKARPLLVAWGATARAFQADFWIRRLFSAIDEWVCSGEYSVPRVVITDVRYANEVRAIIARGGAVFRLVRPEVGPANEEEEFSFKMIEAEFRLPMIRNNGTAQSLGKQVLDAARSLGILS